MSVNNFSFSKDWNDASDFPTHEPDEKQVRADIQLLYDEIKNYINDQIVVALNNIAGAVESLTNLSVPDNSVTYEKLHRDTGEEAVDTGAIRNGAVTTEKIDGGAVTEAELCQDAGNEAVNYTTIRDGAVRTAKLDQRTGYEAVTTATIRDEAVTQDKIAGKKITTAWLDQTSGSEAVTEDTIRDGAVTTDKLDEEAVTNTKIAGEAVRSNHIQDKAIEAYHLDDEVIYERHLMGSITKNTGLEPVTTDTIRNGAVKADKIATDAVTFSKLANFTQFPVTAGNTIDLAATDNSRALLFTSSTASENCFALSITCNGNHEMDFTKLSPSGPAMSSVWSGHISINPPKSNTALRCLLIVLSGSVTNE